MPELSKPQVSLYVSGMVSSWEVFTE